MNLVEKTTLFILAESAGKSVKGLTRQDVRDEYNYTLKDLVRDGYLDAIASVDENGTRVVTGHKLTERGTMKFRMLSDKWEEEQ